LAPRTQTKPLHLFLSALTRRDVAGTQNARAAFGDHRDGTKGTRQMVIGFLCDEAGHPVSIAVVPGTPHEPHTCAAQLAQGHTRFGVTASTCVGARGMIKGQPIEDLAHQGFPAIPALTKPQMEQLLRQGPVHMDLFDQELAEVLADEGLRYVRRRHPVRAQEVRDTRQSPRATLQAQGATHQQSRTDPPRANAQGALPKLVARAQKRRIAAWVELTVEGRSLASITASAT